MVKHALIGRLAFELIYQVDVLLHGVVGAEAIELCPGGVLGFGNKVEGIGWAFGGRIALGGLLIKAVKLQQGVVIGASGKEFAIGNGLFEKFFQFHEW